MRRRATGQPLVAPLLIWIACLGFAPGCSSTPGLSGDGLETTDAGPDAGDIDAGPDADAGSDAGADAGAEDAGHDAGLDAGARDDAGSDAGVEDAGREDAGRDAGEDAGLEDAGRDAGFDAGPEADAGQCLLGATLCAGLGSLQTCTVGDAGATVWTLTACAPGSSCLSGACVTACTDVCDLGATEVTDAGTLTCELFDTSSRGTIAASDGGDAGQSMENRARLYNAFLRENGLPAGQVTYLEYTAPDLTTLGGYADSQDAAIFTGTYLAAEAWRYKATGSPDALANVTALVQTLHMLFNVTPSPGNLARFAAPQNSPVSITNLFNSTDPPPHSNGLFDGGAYDWQGHVSRDQYQGVLLGYSVAYDVLTDETVRDLIRQDLVTFVTQLMMTRSICPVIDGVPCFTPLKVQYVILNSSEPLQVNISTSSQSETLSGLQEFMPMVFGLYPDPTVAVQLASAFEVALQVTANQPAWATDYATINTFFQANVDGWLNVAQGWNYQQDCGASYFTYNILFEPMYDLARLDQDPTRRATIHQILSLNMWAAGLNDQNNSWFGYIFAAADPSNALASSASTAATTQLEQFGDAPRVHVPVTNTFPADPSCPGNALNPINVGDRTIGDFLWQREPWTESDPGVPTEVFPGVDYLAAYWLGRAEGFLSNDSPTQCTLWEP